MAATQTAPCMIDWNVCEKYINMLRNSTDNCHPFMYAVRALDWNAVMEFYKTNITIEDEYMFIRWCIENGNYEFFPNNKLRWSYNEMWKLFERDNMTERFTDDIKKRIWTDFN